MEAKKKAALPTFKIEHTQSDYWGGSQLSFTVFKVITVLLGFFAIDHLVLRSPTTAFVKVLANIFTFGYFYFYDVIQVFAEEDSVRENGIAFPFAGILGIGKGMFHRPDGSGKAADNAPSPYLFAVYCIAVLIGFGLDFLVAGDFAGGAAKLFSIFPLPLFFLMPIFWIFTLLWWLYNIARTFFYTDIVLDKNAANKERGIARFFPMNMIMNQYYIPVGTLIPMEKTVEPCERPLTFPWNMFAGFGRMIGIPIKIAGETAATVVQSAVVPIQTIITSATGAVAEGAKSVATGASAVGNSLSAAATLSSQVPGILQQVQQMQKVPSGMVPAMPAMPVMPLKKGGSLADDGYILLGLFALVLGGTGLTVFRSMKNEYPDSDTPPNPRTGRKPFLPSQFGSF
jgi:hypothetical protein